MKTKKPKKILTIEDFKDWKYHEDRTGDLKDSRKGQTKNGLHFEFKKVNKVQP